MTTSGASVFLVDTNVLVYAYDAADPVKRETAIDALALLYDEGIGALSVQVLNEFYTVVTRKSAVPLTPERAEAAVGAYVRSWSVYSTTPLAVREGIRISRVHRTSYWDGLILATARLNEVPYLLSEDLQDGRDYDGVTVINPFRPGFNLAALG